MTIFFGVFILHKHPRQKSKLVVSIA